MPPKRRRRRILRVCERLQAVLQPLLIDRHHRIRGMRNEIRDEQDLPRVRTDGGLHPGPEVGVPKLGDVHEGEVAVWSVSVLEGQ